MRFYLIVGVIMAALWTTLSPAASEEIVSTLAEQQEVAVTIYNHDLALVKDKRLVLLQKGRNHLAMREVSGRMRPETALLRTLAGHNLTVVEQNFDFDLLTPEKMVEKYVGKTVSVLRVHPTTGEETTEEAVILSANHGVVLKIGDRIETGFPGRLIFPAIPANLRERPTLVMTLDTDAAEAQLLELSYLTSGLGWKADYVASLAPDEKHLAVSGWVTLTNTSGASYNNARLQLVAGDVHQVPPEREVRFPERGQRLEMAAVSDAMVEESLFEYHLYTLQEPTAILENQTKQVSLLQGDNIGCRKEFLLRGGEYYYRSQQPDALAPLKISVFLTFQNSAGNHLGLPLPKGVVRVYKQDRSGNVQFVGEDRLDHTPENESVRLLLGDAFDLSASRQQTDFKKLAGGGKYNYVFESAYTIVIKNAKAEAVTVRVEEPMPGDWQIIEESQEHRKESSAAALWEVPVAAKSEAALSYRVKIKF